MNTLSSKTEHKRASSVRPVSTADSGEMLHTYEIALSARLYIHWHVTAYPWLLLFK